MATVRINQPGGIPSFDVRIPEDGEVFRLNGSQGKLFKRIGNKFIAFDPGSQGASKTAARTQQAEQIIGGANIQEYRGGDIRSAFKHLGIPYTPPQTIEDVNQFKPTPVRDSGFFNPRPDIANESIDVANPNRNFQPSQAAPGTPESSVLDLPDEGRVLTPEEIQAIADQPILREGALRDEADNELIQGLPPELQALYLELESQLEAVIESGNTIRDFT